MIFGVITNKLLPRLMSRNFHLFFLLGILVSSTRLKSSAHFKIIYVCGVGFQCHCFACEYQDFPTPFVKETIFSLLHILDTLVKDQLIMCVGLFVRSVLFHWPICQGQVRPQQTNKLLDDKRRINRRKRKCLEWKKMFANLMY